MPPDPAPIDLSDGSVSSLGARLELLIQRVVTASRWLLVPFYAGLAAALAIYGLRFLYKVYALARTAWSGSDAELLIGLLGLIDAALVASLVVMVMISGYDNFVGRIGSTDAQGLARLDPGSVKLKLAITITVIAAIHLLQAFLNLDDFTTQQVLLLIGLQAVFIAGAVLLAVIERLDGRHR